MSARDDVVEDEEVGALGRPLRPRALETGLALVGGEPDDHLPGAPSPADRREDVGRRLELDLPRRAVLRPLGLGRRRGAIVGDGSGHDDDVRVRATQRLALQVGGRRRLDDRDTRRAPAPRGSPRAGSRPRPWLSPPRPGRRPCGPTSGCRRSARSRAARASRRPRRARAFRASGRAGRAEQASMRAKISSGSAMRPTPSSPSASSPSAGPTSSTPRARSVATFSCVAGWSHMRVFIAGATSTGPACARTASVSTSSARPCAMRASVFAVSGATTSRSQRPRCGYGSSLGDLRASAVKVSGATNRSAAAVRHRLHLVPGPDEQANERAGLVGRNPAGALRAGCAPRALAQPDGVRCLIFPLAISSIAIVR